MATTNEADIIDQLNISNELIEKFADYDRFMNYELPKNPPIPQSKNQKAIFFFWLSPN